MTGRAFEFRELYLGLLPSGQLAALPRLTIPSLQVWSDLTRLFLMPDPQWLEQMLLSLAAICSHLPAGEQFQVLVREWRDRYDTS